MEGVVTVVVILMRVAALMTFPHVVKPEQVMATVCRVKAGYGVEKKVVMSLYVNQDLCGVGKWSCV